MVLLFFCGSGGLKLAVEENGKEKTSPATLPVVPGRQKELHPGAAATVTNCLCKTPCVMHNARLTSFQESPLTNPRRHFARMTYETGVPSFSGFNSAYRGRILLDPVLYALVRRNVSRLGNANITAATLAVMMHSCLDNRCCRKQEWQVLPAIMYCSIPYVATCSYIYLLSKHRDIQVMHKPFSISDS
ncbi:predicted protein [Clavispora lusitaniae ATCC 42720]|uniref:Uncharacterized protein n=1 Tax=Clavispora lusitaniae (strain ATCC 42720) TaxID=306902 RepID=C4YCH9_CLAL4|nr:uncharacterized protein CLUG_05818 [Clavispora lusitaniae ATCC 42720]EEQ41690.1 predicted protein [Clavispora lusitaniae ATCC 42720]